MFNRKKIKVTPSDKRIRTFFALLPVELNFESRWFKIVTVEEVLLRGRWRKVRFVDNYSDYILSRYM